MACVSARSQEPMAVVPACVDAFNARDLDRRVVATSTLRSGQAGLASLDAVHRLAGEQTAAARSYLSAPTCLSVSAWASPEASFKGSLEHEQTSTRVSIEATGHTGATSTIGGDR